MIEPYAKKVDPNVDTSDMSQERVDETAKQRHDWVGLTNEEMLELFEKYSDRPFSLMLATHDKVKEKNT